MRVRCLCSVEGQVIRIDDVQDGGSYALPEDAVFTQTNLFFTVTRLGPLFVKTPTDRGWSDYRTFIRDGQVTDADIRPLEDAERFENLDAALEGFPDLKPVVRIDREVAHYLVVHRLQHERLLAPGLVGVPESRFALASSARLKPRPTNDAAAEPYVERGFSRAELPAIFQERIPGATLWDMFDFERLQLHSAWQPHKAAVAAPLAALVDSSLVNHIDWNIRNFVFHGAEQRLYYVDSKPTLYVARASNDQNLTGIRTHFLA